MSHPPPNSNLSDGPDSPEETPSSRTDVRVQRAGALAAAGLLGALTGLAVLVTVLVMQNRGRLPRLEPSDFYDAQLRWERAGVTDYNMTVLVTGRQAAEYYVEVRRGEPRHATRNGEPLRQQRTWGTWSVPGMFGTMQSDVTNLERQQAGRADPATPQLLLRAVFDPQRGYPRRYLRTELRKWGTNDEVSWEATLEVVDAHR
jgi:hypothetical protein